MSLHMMGIIYYRISLLRDHAKDPSTTTVEYSMLGTKVSWMSSKL